MIATALQEPEQLALNTPKTVYNSHEEAFCALLEGRLFFLPRNTRQETRSRTRFQELFEMHRSASPYCYPEELGEMSRRVYGTLLRLPAEQRRGWDVESDSARQACLELCKEYLFRWTSDFGIPLTAVPGNWRRIAQYLEPYTKEMRKREDVNPASFIFGTKMDENSWASAILALAKLRRKR